jgi:bacteriochlorophyllide a dehydrogenase
MKNKAYATVATAIGEVNFTKVSIPEPTSEDVIVKISHSWISPGTERSFIMGERLSGEIPRMHDDPLPFPLISGYQKVGTIEWVGADVPDLAIGMTVFATVSKVEGIHFPHAGHVSPSVVHHSQVWQLPNTPDPIAYSGVVLTQVGYNCGIRGELTEGDVAVVIGDGLVGQWAAQTLIHRKARVLLVGKHPYRLDCFKDYLQRKTDDNSQGRVVDITQEDVVEVVKEWATDGVKILVDTVGTMESVKQFMPLMKRNGHITSAGFLGTEGLVDIQELRHKELSLHAPSGWLPSRMEDTIKLIADDVLHTESLITHQYPVSDAKKAFDLIIHRNEPSLGIILDWSEQA